MNIAIDCRLWDQGGVGRYIRNLVYYLQKLDQKNNYTLYFLDKTNFVKTANFDYRITKSKWHSLKEQWQFAYELNKNNYDLVHFPYFSHPIFYNRPFVITIHDLTILHYTTGKASTKNYLTYLIKKISYFWVLSHGIGKAKAIIAPSLFVKQDLEKQFGVGNKTVVTYEGVGYEMIQAKQRAVDLPKKPYFLYVGNFYPHKNINTLVRVWAKNFRSTDFILLLAGPDDYFAKRLKKLIHQLNIQDQIQFVHNITDGQLKYLYKQAKALIFPSFFEGFGLPIVEAAYYNCPLLLSDIEVFKEIAPKSAVFFKTKDQKDMADKIGKIRNKTVSKSFVGYFEKFNFEKMAKQTLEIYQKYY